MLKAMAQKSQLQKSIGLKIDVDTERGTRIGVPNLIALLSRYGIHATFLFSLGRDNTGRAIRRIFRPGFWSKVSRTSVVQTYGLRTLTNGLLWPGPHIGRKHAALMRSVEVAGHEVGVHCYDHVAWQDNVHKWSQRRVYQEVNKAAQMFHKIFSRPPTVMGSAGWQANQHSLEAYDRHQLLYASDTRGTTPFYPVIKKKSLKLCKFLQHFLLSTNYWGVLNFLRRA